MQEIFRLIEMVAPSTASVLITGPVVQERKWFARTIHELSPRLTKAVRSYQLCRHSETLIESEIFGHEKAHLPEP